MGVKSMEIVNIDDIVNIIYRVSEIKISQEDINSNLTELGMDSIKFIQIIVAIEEAFDCEIPDSKLLIDQMDTVQKMINVLQELNDVQVR